MKMGVRFRVPAGVMARRVGEEVVILEVQKGTYYGLEPVGARMWELIVAGRTLGEACDALLLEYDVDRATLEADILRLGDELASQGLIEPH